MPFTMWLVNQSPEMIQVLKVVSDNLSHPLEQFDAEKAVELISDQTP